MKNLIILLVLAIVFTGCKLFHKKNAADALSISYGSGGGFTGAVDEFILKENGQLLQIKPFNKDTIVLKKLSKEEKKIIFDYIISPEFDKIELNELGNMTTFINYYKGKVIVKSYHWTDESIRPEPLVKLYSLLMQHTVPTPADN